MAWQSQTLAAAMSKDAVDLTVVDATGFPPVGVSGVQNFRARIDGETVDIRSVHHLAGTSLPTSTPIGYVFEQRGRPVGAVELNGRPALVVEPGASPELRRTLTLAALALGVFWDPANTET